MKQPEERAHAALRHMPIMPAAREAVLLFVTTGIREAQEEAAKAQREADARHLEQLHPQCRHAARVRETPLVTGQQDADACNREPREGSADMDEFELGGES